jgi:hypothetical protein
MSNAFDRILTATAIICVSVSACREARKAEVAPVTVELDAIDHLPDSESLSSLKATITEVVHAVRNGQYEVVYERFVPEIRRAVPFYEFLKTFGVKRSEGISLPEDLPEGNFSRVRDRVGEVFIMQPRDSTQTAVHLDLVQMDQRWLLRTLTVYGRPSHSFFYSGGLITPGTTRQDLFRVKEAMLQKALMTSKDYPNANGFPDIHFLQPSIPVFVKMDLDLPADSQIHVPGWTVRVVSEATAIAREGQHPFFEFNSLQIFGDLALGALDLGHPAIAEGGGGAEIWMVRRGDVWRFYKYGSQWIR